MGIKFPETPAFTGHDAPSRVEADIHDLEVEGEIPAELNGVWYRVGPDPHYPPLLGDDIFISGDGMISAFRFENGVADYKSRYVRTARYEAEDAAKRPLFGVYRNPFTDDPSTKGVDRTTANTTPLWHGGRLVSLKEDGLPYQLDPDTLETIGRFNWDGAWKSETFTAHPKVCAKTGNLYFFGYEAGGLCSTAIAYGRSAPDGSLLSEEWFDAPYAALVHDFAITDRHAIFPIFPTTADLDRLKAGGVHWAHERHLDSHIGIMPRDGSVKDMRWFKRPSGFSFHVINAFSEGDLVHLDLVVAEMNPFPFIPNTDGTPYDPMKAATMPMRWTFDMTSNDDTFAEKLLSPVPGDVPRVDDRFIGQKYRHSWMGMIDPTRPMQKSGPVGAGFNMVGRLDADTGESDSWYGDDVTSFQEPQFIPTGAGEAEGYVVCVMDRHDTMLSSVGIFRALDMAAGPVAELKLPFRLRMGVHGTWRSLKA